MIVSRSFCRNQVHFQEDYAAPLLLTFLKCYSTNKANHKTQNAQINWNHFILRKMACTFRTHTHTHSKEERSTITCMDLLMSLFLTPKMIFAFFHAFPSVSFAMHCDPIYIWLTTLKWWMLKFFWKFEWHIKTLLSWDICLPNIYAEHVWIFCAQKNKREASTIWKSWIITLKTKKEKNTFQFDTYALHSTAH